LFLRFRFFRFRLRLRCFQFRRRWFLLLHNQPGKLRRQCLLLFAILLRKFDPGEKDQGSYGSVKHGVGLRDGFEKHLPDQWGAWQPESWEDFHAYHALIDYDHPDWTNWWGKNWVRAGIGDYDTPPNASIDPVRGSLAFLPDFKTGSDKAVDLPVFLQSKEHTRAEQLDDATVRDYLITWLTDWVREFGVDGFRVYTAKHVEPDAWQQLKAQAQKALDSYRSNNPGQPLPAEDFWMVAEVFPHTVTRSSYFDAGFDAVINFDLQEGRYAR